MNQSNYIKNINGELWFTEDDRDNLKVSYRIKEIIYEEQSSFQHIMLLDSYDFSRMLVLDGVVQTTEVDGYIYNEMMAHVPVNFHPNPKKVLIIGGGDCGVAREVAKYRQIEQIDMVEIDEKVTQICKKELQEVSGNLSDSRVNFIFDDGIAFVKDRKSYYDIIIVDSSDPIGPAACLFELEFYKNVAASLNEDGIMVCQSESPIFYAETMKSTYKFIGSLLPITKLYIAAVPTYPGGWWSFTLGSKKYCRLLDKELCFDTKYINKEILKSCFILPEFILDKLK